MDHQAKTCVFTDHQIFDRFHKYTLRSFVFREDAHLVSIGDESGETVGDKVEVLVVYALRTHAHVGRGSAASAFTDYVYEPGHYAVRGSILDIYGFSAELPVRVDFFGDEIDSIRSFNVETPLPLPETGGRGRRRGIRRRRHRRRPPLRCFSASRFNYDRYFEKNLAIFRKAAESEGYMNDSGAVAAGQACDGFSARRSLQSGAEFGYGHGRSMLRTSSSTAAACFRKRKWQSCPRASNAT